jgi:hypothetical protein
MRPHNEELHNLYTSPNIIRVVKSRRMRRVHMRLMRMHTNLWLENQKGRDHSEDLGVDWRVILQMTLGK